MRLRRRTPHAPHVLLHDDHADQAVHESGSVEEVVEASGAVAVVVFVVVVVTVVVGVVVGVVAFVVGVVTAVGVAGVVIGAGDDATVARVVGTVPPFSVSAAATVLY